MSEPTDGPSWEPPTEHDKLGDDPPTRPSTLAEAVRARASHPQPPTTTATAAGSVAVVATGADAARIRKLCQSVPLHVSIVASLALAHDGARLIVIGEPSPPAPEGVVYVARPTLSDDMLLALLRASSTSRVIAEPPSPPAQVSPRVQELATRIEAHTDRAAIEQLACEAIATLAGADRAHLLFHDPVSGALWSETRQRETGDRRRAVAGVVGWCAHTGHAVMASPAGDDPRYLLELDDPDGKPQARLLVQPVIGADCRVHALLVAVRRWRRTDFTDAERRDLWHLASRIAPMIEVVAGSNAKRSSKSTLPGIAMASTTTADAAVPRQDGERKPPAQIVTDPPQTSPTLRSLPPVPGPPTKPPTTDQRAKRPSGSEPRSKRTSVDESAGTSRSRAKSVDGSEPRDIAVVATDPQDIARVEKLARKTRLELSVLSSPSDVPAYYRIVTLGEAWTSDSDARVAYAARATITDEQLTELLAGIASDRAPGPLVPERPHAVAEARRLQPAFASLRALVAASDIAAAETTIVAALEQLLDADRAYCLYYDGEDGSLWSETRERDRGDDRRAIAGIVGWAARTGRGVNSPRVSGDPRWLAPIDDPDGDPNSQLLAQPLITADRRVLGVLVVIRRPKRAGFSDADAALLAQYAALAGPLLEQLEIADDVQQLLRDTSAPIETVAPRSRVQRLGDRLAALPRWAYAVAGAGVAFAIAALARC